MRARPKVISEKQLQRLCSVIGWGLSLMLVSALLIQAVFAMLLSGLAETEWYRWLLTSVPLYFIAAPCFLLLMNLLPSSGLPAKKDLSFGRFMALLLVALALAYSCNLLTMLIQLLLSFHTGYMPENPLDFTMHQSVWPTLLFAVLLAPIVEEVVFRGVLLRKLRPYGDGICMMVSGTAFALFHGNFSQALYAFALGVFFAYVVLQYGRLRYAIFLHMGVNCCGVLLPRLSLLSVPAFNQLLGMVVLGVTAAGLTLLFANLHAVKLNPGRTGISPARKMGAAFLNPGMLVFVGVCAILFALQ